MISRSAIRALRTDRTREVGLSLILLLEIGIMFVMAPLAATGVVPPMILDVLRLCLAAAAVVLLTRNWIASTAIGVTLVASLILTAAVHSQGGPGLSVSSGSPRRPASTSQSPGRSPTSPSAAAE